MPVSRNSLMSVLANAPSPSTQLQASPWTAPTPNRILRTTAVPVMLEYSTLPPTISWTQNTAAYSAVSPPDPATGQQYFCIVPQHRIGGGVRYDFALNRAAVSGSTTSNAGIFSAVPLPGYYGNQPYGDFNGYSGWAYAIDTATGAHYFLCGAGWTGTEIPNSFHWTNLSQPPGWLGPPLMHEYRPAKGLVDPQGLWVTCEIIWYTNSDGTLWQVEFADVLANASSTLRQVGVTGLVQAVISDQAANPTYYVLSAVPNGNGYDLVEFPADDPDNAVTIQSGYTLRSIKTTPDGAVWKVTQDLTPTDPQHTAAQVAYLVPPFPTNGLTPTWIDPFANADPSFYPYGLTQTILDAVPLSATNILLYTSANQAASNPDTSGQLTSWQLTRVGIGVLDQPPVAFPSYTSDAYTAYTQISQALIAAASETYDIRAHYPTLTAAQAGAYYTKIITLSAPPGFADPIAWNTVQGDLTAELYNLVSSSAFWEATSDLINLQNQIKSMAVGYVSNSLAIPTTATPIATTAGQVNALNIAGLVAGGGGTALTAVAGILGACTLPVGAAVVGVLSAGAALASLFCSFFASRKTGNAISVSDPMYCISAKLGDVDGILGQLFSETLAVIESSAQVCAADSGILATVSGLVRNGNWLNLPPTLEAGDPNVVPQSFDMYYRDCVATFFQAFAPLVTAANILMTNPSDGDSWPTYKGKPVYVSPTHSFTDNLGELYNGALLQYASTHDQSRPLGQDLDNLLFTTWNIPYAVVFLGWGIPTKPSWCS
jgi:hypothetical protein